MPRIATPQAAGTKIYREGSRDDLRVPLRRIALTEPEPPVDLYDTSGPYTDPEVTVDFERGLTPLRRDWILERGDVEELDDLSSEYGRRARPTRRRRNSASSARASRCGRSPVAA